MDHSSANIIHLNTRKKTETIESDFTFEAKEEALQRSESLMHNKENQMQDAFYKKLSSEIMQYDWVLLFGPSSAKTELFNILKKDSHFKDIQIDLLPTDNMTANEKYAVVMNHFKLKN